MANKRKTNRVSNGIEHNPYFDWPAGDAALNLALAKPAPVKRSSVSNSSEKMLHDLFK